MKNLPSLMYDRMLKNDLTTEIQQSSVIDCRPLRLRYFSIYEISNTISCKSVVEVLLLSMFYENYSVILSYGL